MFKSNKQSNNKTSTYAFGATQPLAVHSSNQARNQHQQTFYSPLPIPTSSSSSSESQSSGVEQGKMAQSQRMPMRESNGLVTGGQQGAMGPRAQRRYGPSAAAGPRVSARPSLGSTNSSGGDKSMNPDMMAWGSPGTGPAYAEADDYLHNPDPKRDRKHDGGGSIFTVRGFFNIGCLLILLLCLVGLFAGYPIITYYTQKRQSTFGAYNLGGINSTGQVPKIDNFPVLIDPDTPADQYKRTGFDGEEYTLVFSDEFNRDGRTFYEGDDPFWTGVDLHYWPTGDFEWYDPSAITTKDGNLVITMTQEPINDLNFKSGMLQSWNKLCFQNSMYFEVSAVLPGNNKIGGFWPGVWTMGNLGRAGYGATTEGTWPYTYGSCDIGTLKNQTNPAGDGPAAALETGDKGTSLSFLPGQRLSACTCPGEDHPGPSVDVGRSAPEIDAIEAQIDTTNQLGDVSQSFQLAPFDDFYQIANTSKDITIYDDAVTKTNSYLGGVYQQAASALTIINSVGYHETAGQHETYGFEYFADPTNRETNGHITWVSGGKRSWTLNPSAVGPNPRVEIGQRLIPEEPMYMILNFGMSTNFQLVDFENLQWPATMLIDYVRVFQRAEGRIGCDPSDRPTADYIARHQNAYSNANLTTWAAAGNTFPKNSLIDTC